MEDSLITFRSKGRSFPNNKPKYEKIKIDAYGPTPLKLNESRRREIEILYMNIIKKNML